MNMNNKASAVVFLKEDNGAATTDIATGWEEVKDDNDATITDITTGWEEVDNDSTDETFHPLDEVDDLKSGDHIIPSYTCNIHGCKDYGRVFFRMRDGYDHQRSSDSHLAAIHSQLKQKHLQPVPVLALQCNINGCKKYGFQYQTKLAKQLHDQQYHPTAASLVNEKVEDDPLVCKIKPCHLSPDKRFFSFFTKKAHHMRFHSDQPELVYPASIIRRKPPPSSSSSSSSSSSFVDIKNANPTTHPMPSIFCTAKLMKSDVGPLITFLQKTPTTEGRYNDRHRKLTSKEGTRSATSSAKYILGMLRLQGIEKPTLAMLKDKQIVTLLRANIKSRKHQGKPISAARVYQLTLLQIKMLAFVCERDGDSVVEAESYFFLKNAIREDKRCSKEQELKNLATPVGQLIKNKKWIPQPVMHTLRTKIHTFLTNACQPANIPNTIKAAFLFQEHLVALFSTGPSSILIPPIHHSLLSLILSPHSPPLSSLIPHSSLLLPSPLPLILHLPSSLPSLLFYL